MAKRTQDQSNTMHSGASAMMYVVEDNEAVIKMIIKCRSRTMRRVSRTHRVALNRLFDRINLDSKIQIRYIDTKHQIADILTKGHFTRDEWNNLLNLFNIRNFSSLRCTKSFSLISSTKTMAKRIQDQKEEERVVSKSRLAEMNQSSSIAASFLSASSPIASESLVMSIVSGRPDSRMRIEPNSFDAASTSQVRLKDAYLGGLMEEQRRGPSHQEEEDSDDSDNPEVETWYSEGELGAQNSEAWGQPHAHGARSSVDKESQKDTEATWRHYLQISPHTSHFLEAVFSMVREIFGRHPGDFGCLENVHEYHSSCSGSSRKDYEVNLRYVKNHLWKTAGQLFRETEKLDRGQTETSGTNMMSFQDLR